jgi:hypothetical protein
MTDIPEELVRERAHLIWEREGRPMGKADEHWEQARAELAAGGEAPPAKKPRAPRKAAAPGAEPKPRAPRKPKA